MGSAYPAIPALFVGLLGGTNYIQILMAIDRRLPKRLRSLAMSASARPLEYLLPMRAACYSSNASSASMICRRCRGIVRTNGARSYRSSIGHACSRFHFRIKLTLSRTPGPVRPHTYTAPLLPALRLLLTLWRPQQLEQSLHDLTKPQPLHWVADDESKQGDRDRRIRQ